MADIIVDRTDRGTSTGIVLGLVLVGVAVIVALFFVLGVPSRFTSGSGTPSQTNVNVPAQSQPQTAPNITIPRQIDVNINQPPAAAPAQPAANP
jgi:hypothetical protein